MTEHFHLFALLVANGDFPIPAYQKARELLAAYNKELHHEEDKARL